MARYKLKLSKLDFISPVDEPAQETAKVLLMKRKGKVSGNIDGFARVAKVDDELGLVFCWAFTSKADGDEYYDLHGDCIDENFVKVAMEFMQGARATDEMHDSEADGQVVFGMPMTPEIAKAFGIETDTVGFMVALKPSEEVFAKFKSGEYTGVSIAGLGEREQVEKGRLVSTKKRSALTTAVLGHAHLLYGLDDSMAGSTSWESTYEEGKPRDYSGHSHAWIRAEDGSITIGEAMGHTHAVGAMSAAIAKKNDSKSTTANAVPTVNTTTERTKMKTIVLTEAQHAHYSKLSGEDAEAFLAKSAAERDAVVKAAADADPVIFTGEVTKIVVRKSDGALALQLAEQNEKLAKSVASSADEVAKARTEKLAEIYKAKAAEVLSNFTKSIDARTLIIKSLMSSGAEQATIDEAIASLQGANAAYSLLAKMQGVAPTDESSAGDPLTKFNAKLVEFAKSKNKSPAEATSEFLKTPEGTDLYNEFSAAQYAEH